MRNHLDKKCTLTIKAFNVFLFCLTFVLIDVRAANAKIPEGLTISCVKIVNKSIDCEKFPDDPKKEMKDRKDIGLGEILKFTIVGPPGSGSDTSDFSFKSLILFIGNLPLTDHHPFVAKMASTEGDTIYLTFQLKRNRTDEISKEIWRSFLGSPTGLNKNVTVSVGLPEGERIPPKGKYKPGVSLELLGALLLSIAAIIFIAALVSFSVLCRRSRMIRDAPGPNLLKEQQPPYSLGKTQMAWWFFLVLGSYLFISVATLDYETISAQALILIGIAAGTGLGAVAINSNKSATTKTEIANARAAVAKLDGSFTNLESEYQTLEATDPKTTEQSVRLVAVAGEKGDIAEKRKQLEEHIVNLEKQQTELVSKNFYTDLVTDQSGVSFHRFQNVAWSVVLGMVFVLQVYQNLAMPEFSATLLTLMGITSGTYLGFKFPEANKSQ